ncbi:hypothetical protein D623_10008021 [Myotis brandtii]|nr:hypothetical protein D623_10008021 [Myotis brandtii]
MEDEDDVAATADRLAGPAVDELLASTVSTDMNRLRSWEQDQDGSLEEGVVINAQKNNSESGIDSTASSTTRRFTSRFAANIQEPEYRLTTSLPPSSWRSTEHQPLYDTSLTRWSTAGSSPRRWSRISPSSMPPPEDLRLVLMPWGPWHCHCKSGTMSRTRAGRLQGLSGRLRVGALSQLRTEHRPCTYQQCRCDRRLEECPLDTALWSETQTTTTTTTTTTTPMPTPSTRLIPSPALMFWRQVRAGLEDIWNSLSSVFTKMQPEVMRDPVSSQYSSFLFWRMPIPELDLSELESLGLSDTSIYKVKDSSAGKMTGQATDTEQEKHPEGDALLQYSTFNFWRAPIASIHAFELDLL